MDEKQLVLIKTCDERPPVLHDSGLMVIEKGDHNGIVNAIQKAVYKASFDVINKLDSVPLGQQLR